MENFGFKKISFVGLGLIGGSVAKAIKKFHPDIEIYSHASEKTVKEAWELGICENSKLLPLSELCNVDLIFLCCPIEINISYLYILKQYLTKDIILTDVGSVKGTIHAAVRNALLTDIFVGGHPMAGSEKTGLKYASAELIKNCRYVITTDDGSETEKAKRLFDFISTLDVRTAFMSYEEHDKCAAAISHIPHVLSACLVNFVKENDINGNMIDMAAGAFRDTTRIAGSDPSIWQQICLGNKKQILELLTSFENEISIFRDALEYDDGELIIEYFRKAKDFKDATKPG